MKQEVLPAVEVILYAENQALFHFEQHFHRISPRYQKILNRIARYYDNIERKQLTNLFDLIFPYLFRLYLNRLEFQSSLALTNPFINIDTVLSFKELGFVVLINLKV